MNKEALDKITVGDSKWLEKAKNRQELYNKMYIIINKTTETTRTTTGNFPKLDHWLNEGHELFVISLYSNTIKVPYAEVYNGITEWLWKTTSLFDIDTKELIPEIVEDYQESPTEPQQEWCPKCHCWEQNDCVCE